MLPGAVWKDIKKGDRGQGARGRNQGKKVSGQLSVVSCREFSFSLDRERAGVRVKVGHASRLATAVQSSRFKVQGSRFHSDGRLAHSASMGYIIPLLAVAENQPVARGPK
jgi:hypothetical protein